MSSGTFPLLPGTDSSINERIKTWSTSDRTYTTLQLSHSIFSPTQPSSPPPTIALEDLQNPTRSAAACCSFLAWQRYIGWQLGIVDNRLLEVKNTLRDLVTAHRTTIRAAAAATGESVPSQQECEDIVRSSIAHNNLAIEEQTLLQQKRVLAEYYEWIERNLKTLTRTPESVPDPPVARQRRTPKSAPAPQEAPTFYAPPPPTQPLDDEPRTRRGGVDPIAKIAQRGKGARSNNPVRPADNKPRLQEHATRKGAHCQQQEVQAIH